MANRREEERARLREAREEREKEHTSSERKRLMIGYTVAGVAGLIVIGAIVVAIVSSGSSSSGSGGLSHIDTQSGSTNGIQPDSRTGPKPPPVKVANLKKAAKMAGCDLRLHLTEEGHTHIPPGSPAPDYKTNPPTSGNHVEPPFQQADGAYSEEPLKIDFVHSLEHGRLEIQYSPKMTESQQLELKGLYDTMYAATLLFPNGEMPYAVAATAWRHLIGCKQYKGAITLDAIRDFGKATWGVDGREPVESFPFTGPTPREPSS
ncbi:MAG: DUF3105 domain-containing protein [Solirubrobacterales bacterium]